MWDLPRPGLEPMPPALAGGFLTTVQPGKPLLSLFIIPPTALCDGRGGSGEGQRIPIFKEGMTHTGVALTPNIH